MFTLMELVQPQSLEEAYEKINEYIIKEEELNSSYQDGVNSI